MPIPSLQLTEPRIRRSVARRPTALGRGAPSLRLHVRWSLVAMAEQVLLVELVEAGRRGTAPAGPHAGDD